MKSGSQDYEYVEPDSHERPQTINYVNLSRFYCIKYIYSPYATFSLRYIHHSKSYLLVLYTVLPAPHTT